MAKKQAKQLPGIIGEVNPTDVVASPRAVDAKQFAEFYKLGKQAGEVMGGDSVLWSQIRDSFLTGLFGAIYESQGNNRERVKQASGAAQNTMAKYVNAHMDYTK